MYDCNNALHLKMLGSFEYRRSKEKKSPSAYGVLLISILRFFIFIAAVVEDFPPDLSQPTNLLVTLLTYSSIALQNTKGKVKEAFTCFCFPSQRKPVVTLIL